MVNLFSCPAIVGKLSNFSYLCGQIYLLVELFDIISKTLVINGVEVSYIAIGVFIVALAAFVVQMHYYMGRYGNLHRYRNNRGKSSQAVPPPVSVIVVVRENNYYFVDDILPVLLTQECPEYEVVVVDCSYNEEISEKLSAAKLEFGHLKVTSIKAHGIQDHGNKLALTVGIKAARYEHMIFTTADAYPSSQKWLSLMSKGFVTADVVIGYCGVEQKKGFANKMIRCSRLALSVRYLSAAVKGFPYRGAAENIGYTKSIYFGNKGFDHLNLNIGDDDLFLQKFVSADNVSVVMNPNATMRRIQYGGLGWWVSVCRYFGMAFRFYPGSVKRYVRAEVWSRFLFFAASGVSIWLLGWWYLLAPVLLVALRLLVVEMKVWHICRRLGERRLAAIYPLYDLLSPLSEAYLAFLRRVRPNKTVWR